MPFSKALDPVYERIKSALTSKMAVSRGDSTSPTATLLDKIELELEQADIVIADLSFKKHNVCYELGMAHILKDKEDVFLLGDNPPSLLSHFETISYERSEAGLERLECKLLKAVTERLQRRAKIPAPFKASIRNHAHQLRTWIGERVRLLAEASRRSDLQTNDPAAHRDAITKLSMETEAIFKGGVYTLDLNGVVIGSHLVPIVSQCLADRPYFRPCRSRFVNSRGNFYVSNKLFSRDRNEHIIVVAVPRYAEENLIGILDGVIDIHAGSAFNEMLKREHTSHGGRRCRTWIVDEALDVVGWTEPEDLRVSLAAHDMARELAKRAKLATGRHYVEVRAGRSWGSLARVAGTPLSVLSIVEPPDAA